MTPDHDVPYVHPDRLVDKRIKGLARAILHGFRDNRMEGTAAEPVHVYSAIDLWCHENGFRIAIISEEGFQDFEELTNLEWYPR